MPKKRTTNTQPSAKPAMGTAIINPNHVAVGQDGLRDFSNTLCECCGDCGTCCFSCVCPCVSYAKNKTRLQYLNMHGKPDPNGGETCNWDCAFHGCLTALGCWGWALQSGQRDATRIRYHIRGSGWGDCCTSCWCSPCELTQESREIELEERHLGKK